ncbi:hypothetical protein EKM02_05505 [Flavobacterium sp. RSP49]|uniref:hypothetical protein n=1 Tax=Flavobacterium sp. RSP49 TaxID=2497487 RepID=UPI000F8237C0|nr:hypothetical protein [Flavobacterium sp. RSP49]RTZ01459.1 hypothetical protein EKM02_05505 [Flavobacterium sp. RSP49]
MQQEMDGKLKMIVLMAFVLFCSCKKQNNIKNNGKELIVQNINILIDSVEYFDMSKVPRPEKFKNIKIEKITVGLLDSILIEKIDFNKSKKINKTSFLQFNIKDSDLVDFRSDYKINIVKINNYDINILFVRFSNLTINENEASVIVTKVIGISMIKNRYYFKNKKGVWVFIRKELLGMG